MRWNELQPGDKIYLIVPEAQLGTNHLLYKPQITTIIQSREKWIPRLGDSVWTIKFKYSDVRGKRKPITVEISPYNFLWTVLCSCDKVAQRTAKYGELLLSFDSVSLARTYNEMVYVETKRIQKQIEKEYSLISQINKTFISSEIFDSL